MTGVVVSVVRHRGFGTVYVAELKEFFFIHARQVEPQSYLDLDLVVGEPVEFTPGPALRGPRRECLHVRRLSAPSPAAAVPRRFDP
jgi:hypothetical protein